MSSDLVVAVLGAGGSMGSGLARNIARAGMGVRAWNRTRAAVEPLAGDGAQMSTIGEQGTARCIRLAKDHSTRRTFS